METKIFYEIQRLIKKNDYINAISIILFSFEKSNVSKLINNQWLPQASINKLLKNLKKLGYYYEC